MRFYESPEERAIPWQDWEPWFAWYPVRCEMADGRNALVMFEIVERKETYGYGGVHRRYRERLLSK